MTFVMLWTNFTHGFILIILLFPEKCPWNSVEMCTYFEDGSVRTFNSLRSTIYPTICIIKHTERTTEFNILFHTFYIEIIED